MNIRVPEEIVKARARNSGQSEDEAREDLRNMLGAELLTQLHVADAWVPAWLADERWNDDPDGLHWIRSRPASVRALMRQLPPACVVRAVPGDRCARSGIVRALREGDDTRKSFEMHDEAVRLQEQADKIDAGAGGISSDDPDAIVKLRAKLADVEKTHEKMVAINKTIRSASKERADVEDILGRTYNVSPKTAQALVRDGGISTGTIANRAAEARRIRDRISELEKKSAHVDRRIEIAGTVVEECAADNRTRISFAARQPETVTKELKAHGFRWTPSLGVWQWHMTSDAWYWAERIARSVGGAS